MKVYKSKNGYFYKQYKNGEKKRISEKEYKKKIKKIKNMTGGGLNCSDNLKQQIDEYKWNDLEHLFDTYTTWLFTVIKYGNIICIRDWKIINDNLKGKGIGSYQLMYLLFNSDSDIIFVNLSQNDEFWKKFLNFGGKRLQYIDDSECGAMVEYQYPTLKFLKEQKDEINENKLYESACTIINKYEKNKNVINKIFEINDEETKCSKFKHSGKCRRKGCWWYYDTKKCVPHYGKLKHRN